MTVGEAADDSTSNDDYVAQLLASEAKDKSLKYSALGLRAYLPRRPTDRAPKPNTRFLKNILRDTDTHNTALRRKEEEEARERLRKLRSGLFSYDGSSDSRERSDRTRRHRDRSPHRRDKERSSRRGHTDDYADREYKSRSKRHRRDYEDDESELERDRESTSRSHRHRRDEERYSRKTHGSSRHTHRSSKRSRDDRSESPRRLRSRSPRHRHDEHYDRQRPVKENSPGGSNGNGDYTSDNESDPLEDLVGPLPASLRKKKEETSARVLTRGRGSYRPNTSTIDSHFAHDYNPRLDVDISDNDEESSSARHSTRRPVAGLMTEDDDWEMALEAVRDRANWREKGEERLRAAGFDDNTVQRWKQDPAFAVGSSSNDTEGRIADVKWTKRGEEREWDRGKVTNEDGQFDVKAQW